MQPDAEHPSPGIFALIQPYSPEGQHRDQAPRYRKFVTEHPEWKIGRDRDIGVWRAVRMRERGCDTCVRYELENLLDALGAPYPEPGEDEEQESGNSEQTGS